MPRLAVQSRERHHQIALGVDTDLGLPDQAERSDEIGLRSARIDPSAAHHRRVQGGRLIIHMAVFFVAGEIAIGEIGEQRAAQAACGALLAQAVERHVETDIFLEEQVQGGVEELGVAQMRDHFASIDIGFEKAQLHPVEGRQDAQRTVVHLLRRLGAQNPVAVILAVLQLRDHEVRHVFGRADANAPAGDAPTISYGCGSPEPCTYPLDINGARFAGRGWRKDECGISSGAKMCLSR